MSKESWTSCSDGTLERIASAQQYRNSRRKAMAKSLVIMLALVIPAILLIGFFSIPKISCQQTVAWFDAARTEKLTGVERRSFRIHLLFCKKCRENYAHHKQMFQVVNHGFEADGNCHCRHCIGSRVDQSEGFHPAPLVACEMAFCQCFLGLDRELDLLSSR